MHKALICLTCKVAFDDSSSQKSHYKTEVHEYNLNRKISSLPPLSTEEYAQRLQMQNNILLESQKFVRQKIQCQYCDCIFSSSKGLDNHIRSGKHGELLVLLKTPFEISLENKMEASGISSFEQLFSDSPNMVNEILEELRARFPKLISPASCLFCNEVLNGVQENLTHMVDKHCFFIPDVKNLIDFEGFVSCLAEKIHFFQTCLCCHSEKRYSSTEALRKHMIDKGHTMIGEEFEDLSQFYSYNDDAEFEDLEENEVTDVDCKVLLPSLNDNTSEENTDNYELELPSGRIIGHRRYRTYYNQYLRDSSDISVDDHSDFNRGRTISKSHNNDHIQNISQKDSKEQRKFLNSLSRKMLSLGVKHNQFQPHFREQIL